MPKVTILGSSNSIPDENHENTHLLVQGQNRILLIDCVSNPILRLRRAGVESERVTDLILTHFHPDHVSGVPLLLMDMWLLGRKAPLDIYGLDHTLDRVEKMMGFYDWQSWPNFFPVTFHRLPEETMHLAIDGTDLRIFTSPVRHLIPTIGLRFEFLGGKQVLAYSCDTEPCPEVVELSKGADILIHEAAGPSKGHSSAEQAGAIASEAQVGQLFLIHYPTGDNNHEGLIEEAAVNYSGPISLAEDFQALIFS